jgi:hypothetical protein
MLCLTESVRKVGRTTCVVLLSGTAPDTSKSVANTRLPFSPGISVGRKRRGSYDLIRSTPKPEAIERIVDFVLERGIEGDGPTALRGICSCECYLGSMRALGCA